MNNKTIYTNRMSQGNAGEPALPCPQDNQPASAMHSQGCNYEQISTRTRHAVICENLREGVLFLSQQDRLLAFAGQVLDELRTIIELDGADFVLRKQILLQGLTDIKSAQYKNTLLFGNGTESPLKIHVLENGERRAIQIEQANLRQSGFQSVLQCGSTAHDNRFGLKSSLITRAITEILNLRFRNQGQMQSLERELKHTEGKLAQAETSRRRLFADESNPETTRPQTFFQRISETICSFGAGLTHRFKTFRSTEPIWEEISPALTSNQL